VIDRLLERAATKSRAPHGDGRRIALAVEGGAMRGVISAGMLWALEDLGLTEAFDAVYGSSAGAISGAYFLAGQAGLGTRIYYEDINNARFIDLSRAARRRPIVNLGYLLDDVAVHRKRLDTDRVLRSPTSLTIMATDVDSGSPRALTGFQDAPHLFSAMRASATMPVMAGPPHEHEGHRYLDAGLSEPIPVTSAERDGYTDILVLLTRTPTMRPHPSAFDRYYVAPRLRRVSPNLAAHYLMRAAPYAELVRHIDAGTGPLNRARVTAIRVTDCVISRLERRRSVLENGARRGYDAVMKVFT